MVAATPSGITLAPEGGAHQSIATPLIGMAQDGLSYFEPAFVDELAVIMGWGFRHMQRESGEGGSVYLRLTTRALDQPQRIMTPDLEAGITEGAYWLRKPGPNAEVVVAYTGAVAPEAIEAVGLLGESRRDIGLLAITSADRLHAGWTAARGLRRDRRGVAHLSHIEKLLAPLPRDCGLVTVIDGHPSTLAGWRRAWPSRRSARRRAFRPDRHHRRPLSSLWHRCQCHHRCGGKPHVRRAGAAPEIGRVILLRSPGSGATVSRCAAGTGHVHANSSEISRLPTRRDMQCATLSRDLFSREALSCVLHTLILYPAMAAGAASRIWRVQFCRLFMQEYRHRNVG